EVASGTSYESFLAKRIFEPLALKDTTFVLAVNQQDRLAKLYGVQDGKLAVAPDFLLGPGAGAKHPIPAGGLYSTGPDLAKVYQMMLLQGKLGESRIIGAQNLAEMTKVQTGELKCGFTS